MPKKPKYTINRSPLITGYQINIVFNFYWYVKRNNTYNVLEPVSRNRKTKIIKTVFWTRNRNTNKFENVFGHKNENSFAQID